MDANGDRPTTGFSRIVKYVSFRAVVLFLMVAVGIFLTIVVVNYGGYIDQIHQADINEALNYISLSMRGASPEELVQATEQLRFQLEEAYGLHQPFLLRCIRWFYQTMTFDWGEAYGIAMDRFRTTKPVPVTSIVLGRLPYTLLLAGATNFILFFVSIFVALNLTKKYGSLADKLLIALSPLSSIPNWVYGIVLTVIFAGELHLLPFSGLYDTFPPATQWGYIPIVAKHMVLPVASIFLGMFFSTVYTWRTFFLIHSGEDYLELARAKGVPSRLLERRYMLKPTLPYVITSFTILLLTFWQGIIVLEKFFDWPGLGQLFLQSILAKAASITIGVVVVFAFMLGISVLLLDIIYVLVDPRVKINANGQMAAPATQRKGASSLGSSLQRIWSQYNPRRIGEIIAHGYPSLAGKRLQVSTATLQPAGQVVLPSRSYQPRLMEAKAPPAYCPHLVLVGDPEPSLETASGRYRCTVHAIPQRIGDSYPIRVCQTDAFSNCPRLAPAPATRSIHATKGSSQNQKELSPKRAADLWASLREFKRFPAALVGILIIFFLIGISIYAIVAIPYKEAIEFWKPETVRNYLIPENAQPVWVNWFRKDPLPPTIALNSADPTPSHGSITKVFTPGANGAVNEVITYTLDYQYGGFPQDMLIIFNGQYTKKPFVSLTWTTPDGRQFELGNFSVVSTQRYVVSQDIPKKYLTGKEFETKNFFSGTGGAPVVQLLFRPEGGDASSLPVKGTYSLRIHTFLFEQGSNMDAEVIFYGQVYGLAGTDDVRRDLMVALLWGTPVALAFGFLGAITTGVISMIIAAIGVWYGGWVDNAIQRLTEINMILPALPIAIMIYYLYSKSIWMILGVLILLSIFGSAIKTYRAAFLQIKEMPYIEAAQAYGASNWRIIRYYLVPRIIPLLIPQLVILVPSYVFFEATLAYLQVSDPFLPTWGKVIYDALTRGTFTGHYYWVLEPVALMILTGLAFAVVGFALDSILNPRLRRI
ncbi:MAG: ABC transporter permease subunit [Acidobacteriaceae bacterium]